MPLPAVIECSTIPSSIGGPQVIDSVAVKLEKHRGPAATAGDPVAHLRPNGNSIIRTCVRNKPEWLSVSRPNHASN